METVINAIEAWKDLVVKLYVGHPLAGALLTLVGIGFFMDLEKNRRRGETSTNILIVLFGWAIATPILGFVLDVLSKVWEFFEAVAPWLAKITGSFYSIYDHHPILVGVIILLTLIAYFAWSKWWPLVWPSRVLRIATLVIAVILVAHIADPIANLFVPGEGRKSAEENTAKTNVAPPSVLRPSVTLPHATAPKAAQDAAVRPAASASLAPTAASSPKLTVDPSQAANAVPTPASPNEISTKGASANTTH